MSRSPKQKGYLKKEIEKEEKNTINQCSLCLNCLARRTPHIVKAPCTSHEANHTDKVIRNTDSLLKAPVQTQGGPADIVDEALAPRANLGAGFGVLLLYHLLGFDVAGGRAFCRNATFP
jgi:hypothetical protein